MNNIDICSLREKLDKCRKMKLEDIKLDEVDDLSEIKISRKSSSNERLLDFLISVKNPYFFKLNGKLVKIEFSNNSIKAEESISNVIKSIYR